MGRGNKEQIDETLARLFKGGATVTIAEMSAALTGLSEPGNTSRIISIMFKAGEVACMPYKVWNEKGTPTTQWCLPGTPGSVTREQLIAETGEATARQPETPWNKPSKGIESTLLAALSTHKARNGYTRARLTVITKEEAARVSCGLNALHRKGLVAKVKVPKVKEEKGVRWVAKRQRD